MQLPRWQRNPDGSIMADEDGKAVTEAFYEMQRPVAEGVFSSYQEQGDWLLAGIAYGSGPEWAEAICRRYGLFDDVAEEDSEGSNPPGPRSRPSELAERQRA